MAHFATETSHKFVIFCNTATYWICFASEVPQPLVKKPDTEQCEEFLYTLLFLFFFYHVAWLRAGVLNHRVGDQYWDLGNLVPGRTES